VHRHPGALHPAHLEVARPKHIVATSLRQLGRDAGVAFIDCDCYHEHAVTTGEYVRCLENRPAVDRQSGCVVKLDHDAIGIEGCQQHEATLGMSLQFMCVCSRDWFLVCQLNRTDWNRCTFHSNTLVEVAHGFVARLIPDLHLANPTILGLGYHHLALLTQNPTCLYQGTVKPVEFKLLLNLDRLYCLIRTMDDAIQTMSRLL